MVSTRTAFLLHTWHQTQHGRDQIYAIGCLENGQSVGLIEQHYQPHFYIAAEDQQHAQDSTTAIPLQDCDERGMDGRDLLRLTADTVTELRRYQRRLHQANVKSYEADLSLERCYLIDKQICGAVEISGDWQRGTTVDWLVYNPDLKPGTSIPDLSILCLDIETNAAATLVTAVSFIGRGQQAHHQCRAILVLDPELQEHGIAEMRCFSNEQSLLEAACAFIRNCDPDIISGWNVIDFDLQVLEQRCAAQHIDFIIGRSQEAARYREGKRWGTSSMRVPGRQVLDAMHLCRHTLTRYDDYKLETIAQASLGRGKLLHADDNTDVLSQIEDAYRHDKALFARYCLEDAQLVLDILDQENLIGLTINRAALTGLSLERAWGSVEAFEFLYLSALHQRGYRVRSVNEEERDPDHAPGGFVFSPLVGLHDKIFVFDFKSLYPSIIRTFNIDPLAYALAEQEDDACIIAPNEAHFVRERGILPQMLDVFFDKRAAARAAGDDLASYTYKIVMNSFYGVLGSSGCRFAKPQLAGAITHFGHLLLKWCRSALEKDGYRVLYGDTDSVFVDAGLPADINDAEAWQRGSAICARINETLSAWISEEYQLESRLELEFEKYYHKLLLPPSRGDEEIGRAKGYAGLLIKDDKEYVDIVGLEAVRRDWTDCAHHFQRALLQLLFKESPPEAIEAFINSEVQELYSGRKDAELVYHRALRKPLAEYTRTTPPHVRAARMLDNPSGLIHYLMTIHGPQPVTKQSSAIDYDHYLNKQIAPIVRSIAPFCGIDVERALSGEQRFL